jgi:hypothetical protein
MVEVDRLRHGNNIHGSAGLFMAWKGRIIIGMRAAYLAVALLATFGLRAPAQKPPEKPPIDLGAPPPDAPLAPRSSWSDALSGSGYAHWGVPVGAFHQNEDGGGGLGGHIAYAVDRAHTLALRADFGMLAYGYVSRNARVAQYDPFTGQFLGYDDVSYAVRQHQMYYMEGGPEITALNGTIRPYAFGSAGLAIFHSSMNVRPPSYQGDEPVDRTLLTHGNFTWSTGLGLRIGSHRPRGGLFDVGVRFRRNEAARYANDKAITTQPDGTVVVSPFSGSANLVTIYAGFWVGPTFGR